MATAMEVDCVEDYIQCVFCHDLGQPTKLLQCYHPVCDTCLTASDTVSGQGTVQCVKCTAVTHMNNATGIGEQGSTLKPNHLQDIWTRFETLFEAKPCIMCSVSGKQMMGTHVCLECGEDHLCKSCLAIHATVGGTKHHQPVPLSSLRDPEYAVKLQGRHYEVCPKHNTRMNYHCSRCQAIVCNDCHRIDHRDHQCVTMAEYCDEKRQEITSLRQRLDQRLQYSTWQKNEFEKLVEQSRVDEDAGVNEIADRVTSLKTILDEWGKRKTEELRQFYQNERQQYEANEVYWRSTSASHQGMSTYSKLYTQYASDRDFSSICIMNDVIGEVPDLGKEFGTPLTHKTFRFVWNALEGIKARLDEVIGTCVEEKSLVIKDINVIKSSTIQGIEGLCVTEEQEILATAHTGAMYRFDSNGYRYKSTLKFHDPIAPWNVASHGGEMYVSDNKLRQVKRIDKDGNTTHTISLRGNEPSDESDRIGLAVDSQSGLLYISSSFKCMVYKCALNADIAEPLITTNFNPPLLSPCYLHITHAGDIFVTNWNSHKIHIYDTDGQLKNVLGEKGEGTEQCNGPLGVSSDALGYTYVADQHNHRVHVIDKNHCFIESFPEAREAFKNPFAITVNKEGDIFVSHTNNHISVFRPVRNMTQKE